MYLIVTQLDARLIQMRSFYDKLARYLKPRVVKTTYAGYERIVKGKVYNYFKKLDVSLKDLKPYHIQDFYTELYNLGLKGNTILRYNANYNKATTK